MERKPSPAFAEEEDPETGEAVLGTSSHASLFLSPEQSHERRKTWRRSASDFASDLQSIHLGSALDVIKQSGEGGSLLTLVAGDHEDNVEVWKECQNSGTKFRLFPLRGTVLLQPSHECLTKADLDRHRHQRRRQNVHSARDPPLSRRWRSRYREP